MPIYEFTTDEIRELPPTTFALKGIRERDDLQRLLRGSIDIVSPDTLIISEEFGDWTESRRRIDLLGIDKEANLVVIELKRTEDGGHMELQAVRYAAMVSTMTFKKAVTEYGKYLTTIDDDQDAEAAILDFLGWEEPNEEDFALQVRIVLASAEFSKELTTSVIWLNEQGLDVRCVRLRPYDYHEKVLVDIQQIIPLPETASYQIQLREKVSEERQARQSGRDLTRYKLTIKDVAHSNLPKRQLIYLVIREAINAGISPEELQEVMPGNNRWLVVTGECVGEEFHQKATEVRQQRNAQYEPKRYFNKDDELFRVNGNTYAFTKMWGIQTTDAVNNILRRFPQLNIQFVEDSG